jgi:predicted trehalose synthase
MEAIVIVVVFAVALAIYVGARFGVGRELLPGPAEQLRQLREYRATLREKLQRGQREGWDGVMLAQVADKLAVADRQLEELSGGR